GWVATRWDDDDTKTWQWGGTLVIHQIVVRENGTLGTKIPDAVREHLAASPVTTVEPFALSRSDGLTQRVLTESVPQPCLLETTLKVAPGTREVNLRFGEDTATDVGYQFSMVVDEHRLEFDKRPNWPWGQLDNRGLERPLPDLTDGHEHRLQLVLDEDIATLYLDDTALSTRFNNPAGSAVVLDVIEGAVEIGATSLATSATQI